MTSDSEELFGRVVKAEKLGNMEPDLAALARPFIYDGLIRAFCTSCGYDWEIMPEVARLMIELAGEDPNGDLTGKYLTVTECFACSNGFFEKGIEMKSL